MANDGGAGEGEGTRRPQLPFGKRKQARVARRAQRERLREAVVKASGRMERESEVAREPLRETIVRSPVVVKDPISGKFVGASGEYQMVRRRAGVGPAMSLAKMLRVVAEEIDGDGVSNKEHIARLVVLGAKRGDKWCIEFLADRTEGRPAQALQLDLKRENPLEGASEEELRRLELLIMEKIAKGSWPGQELPPKGGDGKPIEP